jgi:hypothetical protein
MAIITMVAIYKMRQMSVVTIYIPAFIGFNQLEIAKTFINNQISVRK